MRFLAVLFLALPVLAKDSDRRAEPLSPYLPIAVKNPGGRPETLVGLLDSRCGRWVWERTIRRNPSRISTLSAYRSVMYVGIEEEGNDLGTTYGFDLKSGEILFEHPGTVRVTLQGVRRSGVVLGHSEGLTCLDGETGRLLWSWKGKTIGYIPTVGRHRLLVDVEDGFAVVDGTSGVELWRRQKPSDENLVDGPTRLWILKGSEIAELDLQSGKEGRRFTFPKPPKRIKAEGGFVYALFARSVQALDAETLLPSWTWDAPVETSSLFATPQGIVVDTEGGRRKHLLHPESGTCAGSLEVPDNDGSGYTFTRNRVFVHHARKQGEIPRYTIMDGRQGGILWQGKAQGFVESGDGLAGYAWLEDKIWRVDLERHEAAWNETLPGKISEAMNRAGRLLVAAGPSVVALDPLRGDLLWRWDSSTAAGKIVLGYWPVP